MKYISIFCICLSFLGLTSCATVNKPLEYCTHKNEQPAPPDEDKLLQKLIPDFAEYAGCKVGNNCLGKWNNQENPSKYSIAWEKQCGMAIGVGDNGRGSTFTCYKDPVSHKKCCAPLGFEYDSKWVVCEK